MHGGSAGLVDEQRAVGKDQRVGVVVARGERPGIEDGARAITVPAVPGGPRKTMVIDSPRSGAADAEGAQAPTATAATAATVDDDHWPS